ncbi:hypothetical protein [Halobacillus litoralis]|uniref:hypothetical protein n=1 Tax=Halobacillus litoralis TaxID=45668 RepID=UPI003531EEAA
MKKWLSIVALAVMSLVLAACGSDAGANSDDGGKTEEITIGYFPNINHVAGMVAETKDLYSETLPDGTKVKYQYFPDGSSFMTAIETGDIQGGACRTWPSDEPLYKWSGN